MSQKNLQLGSRIINFSSDPLWVHHFLHFLDLQGPKTAQNPQIWPFLATSCPGGQFWVKTHRNSSTGAHTWYFYTYTFWVLKNFTLGKCVNFCKICPATKQRKSPGPPQHYTLSVKLQQSVKLLTKCYTLLSVKLHIGCTITYILHTKGEIKVLNNTLMMV